VCRGRVSCRAGRAVLCCRLVAQGVGLTLGYVVPALGPGGNGPESNRLGAVYKRTVAHSSLLTLGLSGTHGPSHRYRFSVSPSTPPLPYVWRRRLGKAPRSTNCPCQRVSPVPPWWSLLRCMASTGDFLTMRRPGIARAWLLGWRRACTADVSQYFALAQTQLLICILRGVDPGRRAVVFKHASNVCLHCSRWIRQRLDALDICRVCDHLNLSLTHYKKVIY
jgi:hypothetical protein